MITAELVMNKVSVRNIQADSKQLLVYTIQTKHKENFVKRFVTVDVSSICQYDVKTTMQSKKKKFKVHHGNALSQIAAVAKTAELVEYPSY